MSTAQNKPIRSRAEKAIGDIVLAELFVVQATIESAAVLGEGLTELRDHLKADEPAEDLRSFLQRTGQRLTEPYATRFRYLRELHRDEQAAA